MSLGPGATVGSLEVIALVGKGGMGEVYRARDAKLKRDVAIKILPGEFSRDADRVNRFHREAEVLAALNHPNIGAIYDLQEAAGTHFLVLELVDGDTLADRIARGPLSIEDAVPIAIAICEALEAAHERGIVHRDLKPANIKITPDGRVKVLDFGLAKAMDTAAPASASIANSPTLSLGATQAGVVLGTAAYMSPEQAKGSAVDSRSDIFSFGCVLYETLTARKVFTGDTVAETVASVLVREPRLDALPPQLNPRLRELLERCLQKDVKRRWQAIGDVRAELELIARAPRTIGAPAGAVPLPLWKRALPLAAVAIVSSAVAALIAWSVKPSPSGQVGRFSVVLPEGQNFTRGRSRTVAISPDGSLLVYVANGQLYARRFDELEGRPIPGTDQDASSPFFSPDGRWIGFYAFADGAIKKIAVSGGAAVTLCSGCTGTLGFGVSWEGNTIAFTRNPGQEIVRLPDTGDNPEVWIKAGADEAVSSPLLLPGTDALIFSVATAGAGWEHADIVAVSGTSDERTLLVRGGSGPRYVSSGHLVYSVGATLYAVPFDLRTLQVLGEAVPVVESVMRSPAADFGPANFDVARNGTLAYASGSANFGVRVLAIADRNGVTTPVPGLSPGVFALPRISPDGQSIALQVADDGSISVYDLSGRSQLRRLTLDGTNDTPAWSPDGRRVAFRSNRGTNIGLFVRNADGTGTDEQILKDAQGYPSAWSRDGKFLIFNKDSRPWTVALDGDRTVTPLGAPDATGGNVSIRNDGRWIALAALGTRPPGLHVYIQGFPTGPRYQVSRELANAPVWSPDGKELFYHQTESRRLVSVRVETEPTFSVSEPVPLPIELIQLEGSFRNYDVLPDGRFLVVRPAPEAGSMGRPMQRIDLVLNWGEELKQRAPRSR